MPVNKITFYAFEQFTSLDFMPKIVDFLKMKSDKRSENDLKKFAELMFSIKMDFTNHGEEIPESIYCAEKNNNVIAVELKGVPSMESPIEMVESITKVFNPNMFVVLAEAWSLNKHPGEGQHIRDHPDKKECFIIDGRTMEGLAYSEFYNVVNKNGKKEFIQEHVDNHLETRYDDPGEK